MEAELHGLSSSMKPCTHHLEELRKMAACIQAEALHPSPPSQGPQSDRIAVLAVRLSELEHRCAELETEMRAVKKLRSLKLLRGNGN